MMDSPRFRQLEADLQAATTEVEQLDALIEMCVELRSQDVDQALVMADEILERAENAHYRKGTARALNIKGSCYGIKGEYDLGLETLRKAQQIARELRDRRLEARILNNFGIIYRDLADFARALENFSRALDINEQEGDDFTQTVNLTSISNLLYDLNDFESALEYALRCLPIFQRAEDSLRIIQIYNTLGNIYFKQDELDQALHYFSENVRHSEPDSPGHVIAESGLGKVHYRMGHKELATSYLTHALDRARAISNQEAEIICHFYLGRMSMDEERFTEALGHLESGLALANEYSRRHDVMSIHEMLASLLDKMGDIPRAFYHLKAYEQYKEQIFKQTTLNKLRNLQIRQQTELAQKEKEVAERTARLKQQFMANMSHEIRTPMNAITGMTRLLLQREPRPEQLRYLNAIQQSADNLLVIINDILDLSKIEAGKITIEKVDFSVREVLHGVRDMLLLKAEEKGIGFDVLVDERLPKRLVGDPTRINQILINLAGNAVKFTERGAVTLHAREVTRRGDSVRVLLEVQDTGIGIAEKYIDDIFDSFTQAGPDTARKFGGTGLGLTISRELVVLMGGEIGLKSTLGEGTTFSISVPLTIAAQQEVDEDSRADIRHLALSLINLRVLLVEDNEFNRIVAVDTLEDCLEGVSMKIAKNGQEAVDMVRDHKFDIVLMDIQMPVMDGVTATRNIRTQLPSPASEVRIIAMTANVLQDDVKEYLKAGMDAYVAKPFKTDELLRTIVSLQPGQAAPRPAKATEVVAPAAPAPVAEPPLPDLVTDMDFLNGFTGGKPEKMQKYMGMFLENAPRLLAQIDDMMAAKDFAGLRIAAHSLKPQLSYMGVKEEISHIFLIEQTASEIGHVDRLPPLIHNLHRVCEKAFQELEDKMIR
jgi:signal transduction histidine kinase/DNA-binding NarL/FixJ family response regulator